MLFDKKLFKKEEDVVNINVDLLVSSGDDFFNEEFNNEFEKMKKEDIFHNKLENGFKNWEERFVVFLIRFVQLKFYALRKLLDPDNLPLIKVFGKWRETSFEGLIAEQEQLVFCIMEQFDIETGIIFNLD